MHIQLVFKKIVNLKDYLQKEKKDILINQKLIF